VLIVSESECVLKVNSKRVRFPVFPLWFKQRHDSGAESDVQEPNGAELFRETRTVEVSKPTILIFWSKWIHLPSGFVFCPI